MMDIAEDPEYARTLAEIVTEHLTKVGLEQLRRDHLTFTGIWIFDDIADNEGLLMSPRSYEKNFIPAWSK